MQGRTGQDNQPERRKSGGRDPSDNTGQYRAISQRGGQTGRFRAIDEAMASYRNLPPGSTERLRALAESTGQHRAISGRPPERRRLENAPQTPRIARPKREQMPPHKLRRRLLLACGIFVIIAIVAFVGGLALFSFVNSLNVNLGAATTAEDFLNALKQQNYAQAYKDLGPAITLHMSPDLFTQQAQSYDRCFGPVTGYAEIANSATAPNLNGRVFRYSVTRKNTSKPFQLQLTLQQDQTSGTWRISDYGNTLGPGAPTCK
jgi:hypothetical protein